MAQPRYHTTQQVAKMLGVSIPTVVNWVNQGRLDAHKTPGGHRRISSEALERFCIAYAYPYPGQPSEGDVTSGTLRVLVVDGERDFGEMVAEYLQLKGGFDVRVATGALDAGFYLGNFRPRLVLLDLDLAQISSSDVAQLGRVSSMGQRVHVLGTSTFIDSLSPESINGMSLDGVIEKPLKLDEVLVQIQDILN